MLFSTRYDKISLSFVSLLNLPAMRKWLTLIFNAALAVRRFGQNVHDVARQIAVGFVVEGGVQVGGRA